MLARESPPRRGFPTTHSFAGSLAECGANNVSRQEDFVSRNPNHVKARNTPIPIFLCPWCLEEFEEFDPVVVPGLSCFNAANAALR